MATRSLICLLAFVAGLGLVRSQTCTCPVSVSIKAAYTFMDGPTSVTHFLSREYVHIWHNDTLNATQPKENYGITPDDPIGAAFVPPGQNDRRIIYGRDAIYYMRVFSSWTRNTTVNYGRMRKFIEHGGPDAAASHNGTVYVFKGCHMAIRHRWNDWGDPVRIDSVFTAFPCYLHAAWEKDGYMWLLKGRDLWRWNGSTYIGPVNINTEFDFAGNGMAVAFV